MASVDQERMTRPSPLVRRLLAPNPSPFTFTGTQTYVVGSGEVAVIDPGPDLSEHLGALLAALDDEKVMAILCTHTHRDHSPASRALQEATGAPIVGCSPLSPDETGPRVEEGFDSAYRPNAVLADGEAIGADGWTLQAIATPGHTSNHLCFALCEEQALFSGDHVMGWSTTVVAPPDGDMAAYMRSLDLLLERDDRVYYPAHGPEIVGPQDHVRRLIGHRRQRERQILRYVSAGDGSIPQMVAQMYRGIDPYLHAAAEKSVLAHLIHLEQRGMVVRGRNRWHLAGPCAFSISD